MSLGGKHQKSREEAIIEARTKAVALACENMTKWYILNNKGVGPTELVEMAKGDSMLRWCDPPLFGLENPLLVEEYFRGFWTLKLVPLGKIS